MDVTMCMALVLARVCMRAWLTANGSEPSYVDGWRWIWIHRGVTRQLFIYIYILLCVFWRLSPVVHVALVLSPMDVL